MDKIRCARTHDVSPQSVIKDWVDPRVLPCDSLERRGWIRLRRQRIQVASNPATRGSVDQGFLAT